MQKLNILLLIISFIFISFQAQADNDLSSSLSGYILLQVEENGEAWYVNPTDQLRYYMGLPKDAFALMRNLGTGITNDNLSKIPIGFINDNNIDSDNDGLNNKLEEAIGTNPNSSDSDNDGYLDKEELENDYNPMGKNKLSYDHDLIDNNLGKIFIQVENNGEAWYVSPQEKKRYFLGSPSNAFDIMRSLGLGITDNNLSEIKTGSIVNDQNNPDNDPEPESPQTAEEIFEAAYLAIMDSDKEEALKYFTEKMKPVVEYTMDFYSEEENFDLGNLMSGAKLTYSYNNAVTYKTEMYFNGDKIPVYYDLVKQDNGEWLLDSL